MFIYIQYLSVIYEVLMQSINSLETMSSIHINLFCVRPMQSSWFRVPLDVITGTFPGSVKIPYSADEISVDNGLVCLNGWAIKPGDQIF